MITRTYKELSILQTFDERFEYLKLVGQVGFETFGFDRYLNQMLYRNGLWISARHKVILRDNGCDLGISGYEIPDKIIIHHMNPLTREDILNNNPDVFNPDFLICTSLRTHNAIHYGNSNQQSRLPIERTPNDTCPWKR